MRFAAALAAVAVLAGCASNKGADDLPPVPIPQAEKEAINPTPTASEAKLNELQTQLTELLERLDVLNARIAKMESSSGGQALMPVPPSPTPMPVPVPPLAQGQARVPVLPGTSATKQADIADSYRNALMLFGRGKHAESRAAFEHVFETDPTGELADNALYWIGETYFAAGDYSNAMRYYTRVTKEFADQNKAPDAMFKMGLTYVKTGDLAMARRTFEECIAKYPYSTPAASAKFELKRIKY
ncbi:MAG TPA: tol-pal system protein YbgF [Thermoanaerobaculia bacterium]|jgi:tol-pal system protein YbgF